MSRTALFVRSVVRGLFYTACALFLPTWLALGSWWAGPS